MLYTSSGWISVRVERKRMSWSLSIMWKRLTWRMGRNLHSYANIFVRTIVRWTFGWTIEFFKRELDLYPYRLVGNSWHLAFNKDNRVVGFSGTNDNHQILRLQVEQYLSWKSPTKMWSQLLSAKGMMLDLVIVKNREYRELPDGRPYKVLLNFIKSRVYEKIKVHVLINVGAPLEGWSNRDHIIRVFDSVRISYFTRRNILWHWDKPMDYTWKSRSLSP